MSIDSISKAYSKIDYRKPAKQNVITRESLGISIKGPDTAKRKPTALQKMAEGYRLHKEQIEARAKEQGDKNVKGHEKAMAHLKNNTKTNTKGSGK